MDINEISQKVFDLQTEVINALDITIISISLGPLSIPSIHLTESEFRQHFHHYKVENWPDDLVYKYELSTIVGQVKFFTLSMEP